MGLSSGQPDRPGQHDLLAGCYCRSCAAVALASCRGTDHRWVADECLSVCRLVWCQLILPADKMSCSVSLLTPAARLSHTDLHMLHAVFFDIFVLCSSFECSLSFSSRDGCALHRSESLMYRPVAPFALRLRAAVTTTGRTVAYVYSICYSISCISNIMICQLPLHAGPLAQRRI